MKIAYLDCASGISGDMTLGAFVDAGVPLESIQAGIDSLQLPSCRLEAEEVQRSGFRATKIHVRHEPEHAHRHLHQIVDVIQQSQLTGPQQQLAIRIFTRLGEAEARVHGVSLQKVHFHEVGAVDSIADIVGTAIAWDVLGSPQLVCSPVPTGGGTITIAHGRTSVPAPATAELLKGIPLVASPVAAELTTPTGAAIVATLATQFGSLPNMTIDQIGYGAGDRDFPQQANVLRVLVGQSTDVGTLEDTVCVLETNLDDVTAEVIAYAGDQLMLNGALDCFASPIQMKKGRPAVQVTVICRPADRQKCESILFEQTGTLGVRVSLVHRTTLARESVQVVTPWGSIAGKVAHLPSGASRFSPEFESCKSLAIANDVAVDRVMHAARMSYADSSGT